MTDQRDRPGGKVEVPKTFQSGPSDPIAFVDGVGTYVEVSIAAKTAVIWPLLTDINLPGMFSEEFQHATWVNGGPALGASFVGTSENSTLGKWELACFIDRYEPDSLFGWATGDRQNPGARWWYTLTTTAQGADLRFDVSIGPGPSGLTIALDSMPDKEPRILSGRLREMHTSMRRTVDGVRDIAEGRLKQAAPTL